MPLSTYQIISTDNDPQWTSFMDITAGTTGLVNELQDIKSTLRTVSLLTPWISLVGLEGSWAGNLAWTFVDGTHASIQGDQRPFSGTGYLQVGQRVRAFVTAGTIYGQISALGFGSSITTATFVWDSGTLDSGLSDIQTGGDPNAIANEVVTQDQTPLYAVITNGGSGSAFTGALSPVPTAYVIGQTYVFKWTQASQGSDTVNLNGLGALPVVKNVNGAYVNVAAGDIPAGAFTPAIYAGSNFYIGPLAPPFLQWVLRENLQTGNPLATVSNSISETTLFTYSLPGNALTANGVLRIHAEGNYLNNSGSNQSYSLKFYYGGGAILLTTPTGIAANATPGFWVVDITLATIGATNAEWAAMVHVFSADVADGASGGSNVYYLSRSSSAAIDSTMAQTVKLTVTLGAATSTQTFTCYEAHSQLQ